MDFNQTNTTRGTDHTTADTPTTNHEGAPAYEPADPRTRLWSVVTANLLEDNYYREDEQALQDVRDAFEACARVDPVYVLQLAAYSREELYQRDISQVLLVLAANDTRFHGRANPADPEGPSLLRAYAPMIIQRADEPATCLAIQHQLFPSRETVPKPLKNAISDALGQFDAYQLAKYRQPTRDWSLHDVFNMVRPDPEAAEWFGGDVTTQRERYARLMEGGMDDYDTESLQTPETWEDTLSNAPAEWSEFEKWADVLPRMGLFATIRNLRNMRQAGLTGDEIFDSEVGVNDNPPTMADVRRSKVYPFRFYQAYKALAGPDAADRRRHGLGGTPATVADERLLDAATERWLTEAMAVSVENLPDAYSEASTFVAVDMSGSMRHPVSEQSAFSQRELGAFLGAVLASASPSVATGVFGDDFKRVVFHRDTPIPERVEKLMSAGQTVGNSTNGYRAVDHLTERDEAFDRLVVITDCQLWDSTQGVFSGGGRTLGASYEDYVATLAERGIDRPPAYVLDVASYGDLVMPSDYPDVYHISGWSETVLDYIAHVEQDPNAVVEDIRSVDPRGLTARGRDPVVDVEAFADPGPEGGA